MEIISFCITFVIYTFFLIVKSLKLDRKFCIKSLILKNELESSRNKEYSKDSNTKTKNTTNTNGIYFKQILNSWSLYISSFIFTGYILETYLYGGRIIFNSLSIIIGYLLALFIFQPVFFKMDESIKSPYEFLEKRYSNGYILRFLCSFLVCLFKFSVLSLHIWGSAIILSVIFPIFPWQSAIVVGTISFLLTCIKSSVKQFFFIKLLLFILIVSIICISLIYDVIINKNKSIFRLTNNQIYNDRLKLIETKFDFTIKYTIWNQIFSSPISWCAYYCLLPNNFKKIRSVSTNVRSKVLLMSNIPLVALAGCLLVFCGILSFISFNDCDPIRAERLDDKNQIGLYWLKNVLFKRVPFLTGIVFSCLILNSIYQHSNGILQLKETICFDLIDVCSDNLSSKIINIHYIRIIFLLFLNAFNVGFSMVFSQAKNSLFSLFYLFSNTFNPPIFGVLFLSIYNPFANLFGALTSFLLSSFAMFWLFIGRIYFLDDYSPDFQSNMFICENNMNTSISFEKFSNSTINSQYAFTIYKISSLWYPLYCVLFIYISGSLFSLMYSIFRQEIIKIVLNFFSQIAKYATIQIKYRN